LFLNLNSYYQQKAKSLQGKTDEDLVALFVETENNRIIGILFDRYIHLVFASCMKYFKDEDEAQDAAMEIFESLSDKLIKYEVKYFKSWLYTTTKNYCLMQLRKKNPEVNSEKLENIQELSVEFESILHLDNGDGEELHYLKECLAELKPDQQKCINLMYLQNKSYKEIAAETGFDLKRVKSLIQNGKRNLRLKLEEYYEKQNRT
jgi:RNA polymerase sigma-70 factor, ECF subfamily